jgi:type II secretory pathway pseudopilin PulG
MRPLFGTRALGSRSSGSRASGNSGGFTLAEAAVTIAIVAIMLTIVLQSLEGAKISAAHTMYQKTGRELGLELLGEIEAGRWQDEIDSGASGTFANRDAPDYTWDLVLGDEAFPDRPDEYADDQYRPFDNYRAREDWRDDNTSNTDTEDEEEEAQPFEKVKLRIRYPKIRQFGDEIILERWVRWAQIYGEEEEEEAVPTASDPSAGGGEAGTGQGGTGQGGTNK